MIIILLFTGRLHIVGSGFYANESRYSLAGLLRTVVL